MQEDAELAMLKSALTVEKATHSLADILGGSNSDAPPRPSR